MVEVHIFVEGGVRQGDAPNAATADNSARLREAFNTLLSGGVTHNNVKIVVETSASWTSTKAKFITDADSLMLTDMDGPASERENKLKNKFRLDTACSDRIFFMIQTMEAWILSQPDKIENCFADKKCTSDSIACDNQIAGKNPEDIIHPDRVLETILSRYFEVTKGNSTKKLKYGKLKNAPDLIKSLDIHRLEQAFDDVKRLLKYINTNHTIAANG